MAFGPGFMNQVLQPGFKKARGFSRNDYEMGINDINSGYDEAMGYQRPWYDYGQEALADFKEWGKDQNAITSDPSYKWRLNQGTEALENSAAARGGLLSGNTAKGITDYAQNAASQEYGNEFNRWMQKLGIGTNASNNMSSLSANRGNSLARQRNHMGDQWWNQTMGMAQEIRQAGDSFNNILGDWVPSGGMGGGGMGGGGS